MGDRGYFWLPVAVHLGICPPKRDDLDGNWGLVLIGLTEGITHSGK